MRLLIMLKTGTNSLKGKTFEEIYGNKKTKQLKKLKSIKQKGISYKEKYGIKKANIIKNKISNALKGKKKPQSFIDKIKITNSTRIISKKTRLKMGKSHKGYVWSDKSKEKARISHRGEKNHFYGKKHSKETIEKIKKSRQYIKMPKQDTKIEIKLKKQLLKNKIPFIKNAKLKGRPDFLINNKICIFCDGDFWHGNPKKYKPIDLIGKGKNRKEAYLVWKKDKKITSLLKKDNYTVLRFWETDINNDINKIIKKIVDVYENSNVL